MSAQTEQNYKTDIVKTVVNNSAPTSADYKYRIGTMWLNTIASSASRLYICIDNEASAAEWFQINVDAVIT
jgi:hypothetical protein